MNGHYLTPSLYSSGTIMTVSPKDSESQGQGGIEQTGLWVIGRNVYQVGLRSRLSISERVESECDYYALYAWIKFSKNYL